MESVNPSRTELLVKRAQIALARQGRDLLKEKRSALWQELMKTADIALHSAAELEQIGAAARRALAWAEARDGREAVQSAAFAARRDIAIDVTAANVLGMRVPIIKPVRLIRSSVQRGYGLPGSSSRVDEAATWFEEQLEQVIELAARELRLRRLAEEIRKTTIRVNALEVIVLPRLEAQLRSISGVLEEREREDMFRLKRIKSRRLQRAS